MIKRQREQGGRGNTSVYEKKVVLVINKTSLREWRALPRISHTHTHAIPVDVSERDCIREHNMTQSGRPGMVQSVKLHSSYLLKRREPWQDEFHHKRKPLAFREDFPKVPVLGGQKARHHFLRGRVYIRKNVAVQSSSLFSTRAMNCHEHRGTVCLCVDFAPSRRVMPRGPRGPIWRVPLSTFFCAFLLVLIFLQRRGCGGGKVNRDWINHESAARGEMDWKTINWSRLRTMRTAQSCVCVCLWGGGVQVTTHFHTRMRSRKIKSIWKKFWTNFQPFRDNGSCRRRETSPVS